jgi:hypothetical protein
MLVCCRAEVKASSMPGGALLQQNLLLLPAMPVCIYAAWHTCMHGITWRAGMMHPLQDG